MAHPADNRSDARNSYRIHTGTADCRISAYHGDNHRRLWLRLLVKAPFHFTGHRTVQSLRFERLTQKGIAAFSGESTSLHISALNNDAAAIATDYLNNLFGIVSSGFLFVAALAMMFWYSPVPTLVSIGISSLPIFVFLLTSGEAVKPKNRFPM